MPQVAPLRPDDPKRVGRYRLTGRITGIPGSPAYLGRATDGDRVTVTLFPSDRTPDGAARDRFTAEARAARRVAPFCVARILDAGLEGDRAYLVSEYVAGPLLSEHVAADGPRAGEELDALAIGMATGLAAVHQAGLVHGEFGPEHVVLGADGPRVVGFAITPPYGAATPAADMLAWAHAVLFASGPGPPGRLDLSDLHEPLRGLVASCATLEPAARPAARNIVIRLLGQDNPPAGVLAEGSRRAAKAAVRAPAEPPPGTARPGPPPQPRRAKAIGWAAAAAVCIAAIAVAVHVLQDAGSGGSPHAVKPASANRPATSGARSASGPARPSPSPSPTAILPPAVDGTWSGTVQQGSGNIDTDVQLNGNSPDGTITYSGTSFTCSGNLTLKSAAHATYTMSQEIVAGVCLNGIVTLRQQPDGSLKFSFKGASSLAATGTLTRQ